MTVARESLAERLSEALKFEGFGAGVSEHGFAVDVATDQAKAVTVWLPDAENNSDDYIWGPNFEHTAPGWWVLHSVARAIAVTLR